MTGEPYDASVSATQLAYRFALVAGYSMVGSEDAFALLLDDLGCRKYVAVFGNLKVASDISFEHQAAHDALEMARALNAVFSVVGGAVQCEVAGFKVVGATYIDAAMRAVVQHSLHHGGSPSSVRSS